MNDSRGYYVMGRYTSIAWFLRREDAELLAKQMNWRGGTHYTVAPAHGGRGAGCWAK